MSNPAAIFDWDGVVVDSSRLHVLSWEELAKEEGRRLPEGLQIGSLGVKTEAVISDLLAWTTDPGEVRALTLRKEELFRKLAAETGIESQPGVLDFLRELKQAGLACAVGSSAPRLNVEAGMEILGAQGLFAAIVSGDDVTRGKPAPDIFLKAAEQLGRRPDECVVFEDAPAGVDAARAAGMRVAGLLSTHDPHQLQKVDLMIQSFDELGVAEFVRWFEAARRGPKTADAQRV
jgi:beta-phosphoglucomutase family hydrolase